MIRHKHESTTTGTGATITVSTPTGFNNDVTTVRPTAGLDGYAGSAAKYSYVLLDGNGTAWEHGFGRVSGTTFYRDHIIESTNTGARINLSANTHTIIIEENNLTGIRATYGLYHNPTAIGSGVTQTLNWNSVKTSPDGVTEWPGYSAPTLSSTTIDLSAILPYAKSYRVMVIVNSTGGSDGWADVSIAGNGNYYGSVARTTMRLDATYGTYCTLHTSEIDNRCPFSTSQNCFYAPGTIKVDVTNRASGSHTMNAEMIVDYLI